MFSPVEYKITQLALLEERIREAQDCRASQRLMLEQFSQAMNWLGHRLIGWSQRSSRNNRQCTGTAIKAAKRGSFGVRRHSLSKE
jgi:hypothetical protein